MTTKPDSGEGMLLSVACPRCGEGHKGLTAYRLRKPSEEPNPAYNYWATCPATLEPMLLKMKTPEERALEELSLAC